MTAIGTQLTHKNPKVNPIIGVAGFEQQIYTLLHQNEIFISIFYTFSS